MLICLLILSSRIINQDYIIKENYKNSINYKHLFAILDEIFIINEYFIKLALIFSNYIDLLKKILKLNNLFQNYFILNL